jgi:hypothetical protein
MTPETRDDLILRHLDGETSADEAAQVKRLLAEDAVFRSRFFSFVHQTAGLRMKLETTPRGQDAIRAGRNGSTPMVAASMSRPVAEGRAEQQDSGIDYRQIYFNAVLGGIGGLLGWMVVTLLGSLIDMNNWNIYVRHLINGPLYGVCIGFAIGSTEGLIASRSLRRLLHGGLYGAGLGALGGINGLLLGEFIFQTFGGGIWARAVGWAVFGAFIGTSDGFAQKMFTKVRYGVLGGILGGLIGGGTYQGLLSVLYGISPAVALSWGSAIGLIILGACIGALVGLVESLLRKSWLFFLTGRLEGQTRTLDSSRPHTIGSDVSCSIVLPDDPTVAPVHAQIAWDNDTFVVQRCDGDVLVRREGREQKVSSHVLQPGDRVQLGDTKMIFRNVEGRKS